jgi:hypothetical protein
MPDFNPMQLMSYLRLATVLGFLGSAVLTAADSSTFRWRIDAGPSLWLNNRVAFGAYVGAEPSLAVRTDRFYDDGYNRVDASNNLGDGTGGLLASRTGYFGFLTDNQVDARAGTLALHQTDLAGGSYWSQKDTARQPGWHVSARISLSGNKSDRRDWGAEIGLDWARFRHQSASVSPASLRVLTDTYRLGGVVLQRGPFNGRFSPVPGDQRIGDTPSRSVAAAAGTISGSRAISARVAALRFGGWLELARSKTTEPQRERDRWSVFLRGGFALLRSEATLHVDEQAQAPGLAPGERVKVAVSRQATDLGVYFGVQARRTLTPRLALLAGADWLRGANLRLEHARRYAEIDLSKSVLLRLSLEVGLDRR